MVGSTATSGINARIVAQLHGIIGKISRYTGVEQLDAVVSTVLSGLQVRQTSYF